MLLVAKVGGAFGTGNQSIFIRVPGDNRCACAGRIDGNGGGIYNAGELKLQNSAVIGNFAEGNGGGIYNAAGATLTLTNVNISDNVAIGLGGGIYNAGTIMNNTITGGCLVGNTGLDGSDIYSTTSITADGVWWGHPDDDWDGDGTDDGPIPRDQGGTSVNDSVTVSNPSQQPNGCAEYTETCSARVVANTWNGSRLGDHARIF